MNKKWYQSSTGDGLSLTIKGLLIGLVPLIIMIAQINGVTIAQETIVQYIDIISAWIALSITMAGLTRKIYYFIKGLLKK